MTKIVVGVALRDRLGESGARELSELVTRHSEAVRGEVVDICNTRLNGSTIEFSDRLSEAKIELLEKMAEVKVELTDRLADMRVEWLRWSFVFWIGQAATMFAALAMFAQWIRP